MNQFRQHIPNFIDNDDPNTFTFETTQEFLDNEYINWYTKQQNFFRLSKQDDCVILEKDDGFYWWVLGYIKDPASLDLPEWPGGRYRVIFEGRRQVIEGSQVASSCGELIELTDGRQAVRDRDIQD